MRMLDLPRRQAALWSALLAVLMGLTLAAPAAARRANIAAKGKTFTVNTMTDSHDASPGDGKCADTGGMCSLRAAIEEANATGAADTIKVPSGTYDLTLGELDTTEPVTILGAGSASTIVHQTTTDRVFNIKESAASISGMTVEHGNVTGQGGGIYVTTNAALTLAHVVVKQNTASTDGGGIYVNGAITMSHSALSGNTAGGNGGGLDSIYGANLDHLKVFNNTASQVGGGLYNDGSMSLSWSWVKGNKSTTNEGGGIDNDGEAFITQSTLSGNTSADSGGGLATDNPTYLTNDTIYGNTTTNNGGGIAAFGYTTLLNVTVTKNEADVPAGQGGGVAGETSGALQIRNSIVGGNTVGTGGSDPNCVDYTTPSAVNSLGHNLFGPITGCPSKDFMGSDKKNVASLGLGTFGMHGGPTPTVPLLSGSPALKLGTNCPSTDQRGVKRPTNGCDAGAYERTPA